MKLTDQQLRKLGAVLVIHKYPNCGDENRRILSPDICHIVALETTEGETEVAKMGAMPCVMATCKECGYVSLFNLKVLDVLNLNSELD